MLPKGLGGTLGFQLLLPKCHLENLATSVCVHKECAEDLATCFCLPKSYMDDLVKSNQQHTIDQEGNRSKVEAGAGKGAGADQGAGVSLLASTRPTFVGILWGIVAKV